MDSRIKDSLTEARFKNTWFKDHDRMFMIEEDMALMETEDQEYWKLTEKAVERLLKSYEAFCGPEQSAKLKTEELELDAGLKAYVMEEFAKKEPNALNDLEVTVYSDLRDDDEVTVTLELGDAEASATFLYLEAQDAYTVTEGNHWEFAAMVHPQSPIHDDVMQAMWEHADRAMVYGELLATIKESHFAAFDLPQAIEELVKEASKSFKYRIDHDERGEFRAAVVNFRDEDVYSISTNEDGVLEQVEDGFMKHSKDVDGLAKYLIDLEIIPQGSYITE